ncbi:MAG: hypothetical protein NC395_06780 [Prevotella sp.]|nr:hypothetical protein [Prevotella sp.]
MKVKFEAVLDGTAKFINKEIYPGMNDWQEILARITVGRIFENREAVKSAIVNNGIIRTFGIVDGNGDVDIERLMSDLKTEIQRKEKLEIKVPLFGKLTFYPSDADELYNMITDKKLITEEIENEADYIADDMMGEIHDAKHRIKRAMEFKPLYPDIARREAEIAVQELVHAEKDHNSVMELIENFKKTKGEPPEYMMEFWKEKHEHFMEKYARAKCMIELFNKS